MKLYEIAGELRELDERMRHGIDWDEETGEVLDLGAALDDLEMTLEAKIEGCAMMRSEYLAEAKAVKLEADRLAKRAKALENRGEGLRDYIEACLEVSGRDSFKCKTHSVRMQSYKSAQVDDIDALPEGLRRVTVAADKREVLKLLKAGEEVPGAHLVETRKAVIR